MGDPAEFKKKVVDYQEKLALNPGFGVPIHKDLVNREKIQRRRLLYGPMLKSQDSNWTDKEHIKFLGGIKEFGQDWSTISQILVNKTSRQISYYAQEFMKRLAEKEIEM